MVSAIQVPFILGHLHTPKILVTYTTALSLLFTTQFLFFSISTYRLFFHPLVAFCGPRLAALTKIWHMWKCRDSRNHHVLEAWHHQYGTFGTGPNEITLFHASAYEVLDGPNNRNTRGEWHDLLYLDVSPIFTRDKMLHHDRRRCGTMRWNLAIESFDDIVQQSESRPISVNDMIRSLLLNIICDIGFGVTSSCQRILLGPFNSCIWIPRLILECCPSVWKVKHWNEMRAFADSCMESREKTLQKDDECTDLISFFHTFQSRHGEAGWHNLSGDAATVLVAGSDTISSSLILLLCFLARHPQHAIQIQEELVDIDRKNVYALSGLKHLDATINESMRLLPAVPTFGERYTPSEGLTVERTFIPVGSAYEDPYSFIPERWYSKKCLIKDKRAFAPFGIGRTSCVGKKLVLMLIKLFTAAMLSKYDIRFAPNTNDGEAVERDLKDQLTANVSE
ncbi:benzoate 4-monooxygenase cytochrome P450 [Xylaria digitata]|nr:benzoate 4-monooxygenase cytochrome P450 [Xylaria digitata]